MDDARKIAAARRKARRTAHMTGTTHQQALDALARELGREHWTAFLTDPADVPRDAAPALRDDASAQTGTLDLLTALAAARGLGLRIQTGATNYTVRLGGDARPVHVGDLTQYRVLRAQIVDRARIAVCADGSGDGGYSQEIAGTMTDLAASIIAAPGGVEMIDVRLSGTHIDEMAGSDSAGASFMLGGLEWNLPVATRRAHFGGAPFVPAWNALASPEIAAGGKAREAHVDAMAAILVPGADGPDGHFADKGRRTLEAFLMIEIEYADVENRTPSIPAMTAWLREGLIWSAPRKGTVDVDVVGRWLAYAGSGIRDAGMAAYVEARIGTVADAGIRERRDILGVVDKALRPFADKGVMAMNA